MPAVANWAAAQIRDLNADGILVCGHSGLLLAGAVGMLTGVPVFAVRKEGEQSAVSWNKVSGYAPHGKAKRWVWLDDLIASGGTWRRATREAYKEGLLASPIPVACVLYQEQSRTHTREFNTEIFTAAFNSEEWKKEIPGFDFEGCTTRYICMEQSL